jgi:hypothetical protein
MFAVNPFEAIRPDFTLAEHQEARQHLVVEGLTDDISKTTGCLSHFINHLITRKGQLSHLSEKV